MLLSATDAAEIPEFTGLNRTVKLDFLSDDSEEQESRLKLMKMCIRDRYERIQRCVDYSCIPVLRIPDQDVR